MLGMVTGRWLILTKLKSKEAADNVIFKIFTKWSHDYGIEVGEA